VILWQKLAKFQSLFAGIHGPAQFADAGPFRLPNRTKGGPGTRRNRCRGNSFDTRRAVSYENAPNAESHHDSAPIAAVAQLVERRIRNA
jgi:hypothetical protein